MKEKPHPDMSFEMEARASGFLCVAGVDEAGRGPLAGPVVAGAVILPVLAEELMDWIVLPRPMSSARMPPNPFVAR